MIGEETRGRKGLAEAGPRGEWAGVDGPVIGRHRVWGAPGVRPGDGVPGLDQDAPRLVGDIDDGDIGSALRLHLARAGTAHERRSTERRQQCDPRPEPPPSAALRHAVAPLETVAQLDLA